MSVKPKPCLRTGSSFHQEFTSAYEDKRLILLYTTQKIDLNFFNTF